MKITATILPLLFASSAAENNSGLRTTPGNHGALAFNNPPPLMVTDENEAKPMEAPPSDSDTVKPKSTSFFLPTPATCQQDIQSFCSHELPPQEKMIMGEPEPFQNLLSSESPSSPETSMRVLDDLFEKKDSTLVVRVYSLPSSSPGTEDARMQEILDEMMTAVMLMNQAEKHFDSMVHTLLEHSSTVYASESASASQDSPDGEIQEPILEKDYYDPLYLSKLMSSYGKTILEHKEEEPQETDGLRRRLARRLSELPTDTSIRTEPLTTSSTPDEEEIVSPEEDSDERIQTCLWNVIDDVSSQCKTDLIRARNIVRCGYMMSEQVELTSWELFQSIILPILFAIFLCGLFVYLVFLIDVDYDMDDDELCDFFDDYYGDEEILYDEDGNEIIMDKETLAQKEKVAYVAVPIQVV